MNPNGAWFLSGLDTIVHLGAGRGQDLSGYRASLARRIVLVEPGEENLAILKDLARADSRIEILSATVSDRDGRATFRTYNFPDLSGLHPPLPLLTELFPGLRQTSSREVDTVTLNGIAARLGLEAQNDDAGALLVIDVPGSEAAVVSALLQDDVDGLFQRILLNAPDQALYESGMGMDALAEHLQAAGYHMTVLPGPDPDFRQAVFSREPLQAEEPQPLSQPSEGLHVLAQEELQYYRQLSQDLQDKVADLERRLDDETIRAWEAEAEAARVTSKLDLIRDLLSQSPTDFEG